MALENINLIRKKILDQLDRYPEEQVKDIREQVENATDDELEEFLLSRQNQPAQAQCIFCEIAKGEIDSVKIYEDEEILAVLEIMPASIGHIILFPKEHFHFIQDVPDKILNKLMNFVKNISPVLIKTLNAEGISIYLPQGQSAGQRIPHFLINVIPRYNEEDEKEKIVFDWQREKKEKEDLEKIGEKLRKEAKNYFKQQLGKENRENEKSKMQKIEEKAPISQKEIEEDKKEKKKGEKEEAIVPKFPRKIPN